MVEGRKPEERKTFSVDMNVLYLNRHRDSYMMYLFFKSVQLRFIHSNVCKFYFKTEL